jgi:hypothetical protein
MSYTQEGLTMKFDRKFDKFVCVGDTIKADITDKVQLVATLVFDDQCQPTDFDCYEEADIERWKNDEWIFVGIVLSIQSHDGTIHTRLDSLWGNEANLGDNNDHLTDVANELIDERDIVDALRKIYEPVTRAIETLTRTA